MRATADVIDKLWSMTLPSHFSNVYAVAAPTEWWPGSARKLRTSIESLAASQEVSPIAWHVRSWNIPRQLNAASFFLSLAFVVDRWLILRWVIYQLRSGESGSTGPCIIQFRQDDDSRDIIQSLLATPNSIRRLRRVGACRENRKMIWPLPL